MTPNQILQDLRNKAIVPTRTPSPVGRIKMPEIKEILKGDAPHASHTDKPTPEQVSALCNRLKVPRISDFHADHIDSESEKDVLRTAIRKIIAFTKAHKSGDTAASMVIGSTAYGTGKTSLARAAMFKATGGVHWGGNVKSSTIVCKGRFFSAVNLYKMVNESEAVHKVIPRKTPLIVIDDFGLERIGTLAFIATDSQEQQRRSIAFQIIDHCYRNDIGMIITTNETPADFADLIGGAAWSRLQQVAPTDNWVSLNGVRDYRPYAGGHR